MRKQCLHGWVLDNGWEYEKDENKNDEIYEYEPEEEEVLKNLVPQNVAIQIFSGLLENAAGEQGARMTAMDNATRNAGELIDTLKLNYNRIAKEKTNWIINKNIFDNVNPPWDYEVSDQEEPDETTKHSYEWLAQTSNNQNRAANRAMVNYLEQYAYRAPNNPHINKNYDGTPIEIDDINSLDLNSKVSPETYHYRVRRGGDAATEFFNPAPYYYEYKGSSDIYKIRNSSKGGEDNSTIPKLSQQNGSFKNGSRLRVTKYVYRLYTKHAVVVGDSGFKNSRSSQQGWDYQLQYSIDSGTTWEDIDAGLGIQFGLSLV